MAGTKIKLKRDRRYERKKRLPSRWNKIKKRGEKGEYDSDNSPSKVDCFKANFNDVGVITELVIKYLPRPPYRSIVRCVSL